MKNPLKRIEALEKRIDAIEKANVKKSGPEKPTFCCSFCGKSRHDVHKLIAGPTVFICDECVLLCVGICMEPPKAAPSPSKEKVA